MISLHTFCRLAQAFEEVTQQPHFEKTSFRVNKKIFATLDASNLTAALKLSEMEQSVFCAFDKTIIYPVSGAWGRQGWTIVELKKIKKAMLRDALTTAYCNTAPAKLSEKYRNV